MSYHRHLRYLTARRDALHEISMQLSAKATHHRLVFPIGSNPPKKLARPSPDCADFMYVADLPRLTLWLAGAA